ncbi:CHAT domain-containing protein [Moorena producens JHB]|uniref:CHAT domain-containing protein n=1 Tax=Moorena producens (strain JHB) TaxID=1454205 RepID=A0A1D9G239_MOOP1|nr:CHAT domain-containing protein [Moorena producens]AOY81687.1 CHAT domain-containing protein [Moorena producens JHB]
MSRQSSVRTVLGLLFLSSLTITLWLGHLPSTTWQLQVGNPATAQSPDASQLVQQGVEHYQLGDFTSAIEYWQTALTTYQQTNNRPNQTIVLENLARAYQQIGQIDQAINYWEKVITNYQQLGDLQQVGRMLTELAQAYSKLGQNQKAIALLCATINHDHPHDHPCVPESALQLAHSHQDQLGVAAALGSLGDAYRLRGKYDLAINYLEKSLTIAQDIDHLAYQSSALNSLGNAYSSKAQLSYRRANSAEKIGYNKKASELEEKAKNNDSEALKYFQKSLDLAITQNDQSGQIRARLNEIPLYYRLDKYSASVTEWQKEWQKAYSLLESLPDSQDKVYAAIELANLLQPIAPAHETSPWMRCYQPKLEPQAIALLTQAVKIAQRINDHRSQSFALGELGHIYECRDQYTKALGLSQQARLAAEQNLLAQDSLYLWEWQTARIFKEQGKVTEAIGAYENAIATLETIRSDILTASRDVQFDFLDTVNPIYRQLVELRLEGDQTLLKSASPDVRTQNINIVLKTVDALKLAELQDYFGNDCVLPAVNPARVDLVSTRTAVISTIILKDRTAVILSLPNGAKQLEWIDSNRESLRQDINQFRKELESFFEPYNSQQAQKIYNGLIRPFANQLEQAQIETLVFINDGILRTVPMAALHDGEKFLVERYAIATTPTLTLTEPKPLTPSSWRALVLGLTKEAIVDGREFEALSNVSREVKAVTQTIPESKQLLDEEFTRDRLQEELGTTVYPIIHIATHGEFGTEPEDTFLVTGENDQLTIDELDRVIRSVASTTEPVELLSLTACRTATGDDRAALGLAGVAVQAGARSALASLWFINDKTTAQIAAQFYQGLRQSNLNKAQALRAAQIALLEAGGQYARPAYWAPYLVIGNWF